MRVNKTDRNDARGLAELARMGWYREANVKSTESRYTHSLLAARAKLVDLRRDVENQMRGLLKGLGLPPGKAGIKALLEKIVVIMREAPHLRTLFNPMMLAHSALVTQVEFYDVQILKLAKGDQTTRRLMTVPGVGPATALAFRSTIDDPNRFKSSSDVGAYLGLTPRRYQSGELDRTGRISKRGDRLTRLYLFEAASVLLSVVKRWSVLKAWGEGQDRCRPQARCRSAFASGSTVPSSNGARRKHDSLTSDQSSSATAKNTSSLPGRRRWRFRSSPRGSSKTAFFTLRRHATERHHAAPSSQSRWTTAKRTMTPAEASLKGVDRPPAIKERTTISRLV